MTLKDLISYVKLSISDLESSIECDAVSSSIEKMAELDMNELRNELRGLKEGMIELELMIEKEKSRSI